MKSKDGFTFVELVIVIAIIAIITAVVTPNLIGATNKSKIKSDIQSVITIQNAIDLYIAEYGKPPTSGTTSGTETASNVIETLQGLGFIKEGELKPQTEDGKWTYDVSTRKFLLDISSSPVNGRPELVGLADADLQWITGMESTK